MPLLLLQVLLLLLNAAAAAAAAAASQSILECCSMLKFALPLFFPKSQTIFFVVFLLSACGWAAGGGQTKHKSSTLNHTVTVAGPLILHWQFSDKEPKKTYK